MAAQQLDFKEAAFGPWRTSSLQFYRAGRCAVKTVGTIRDVNTHISTSVALECPSGISTLVDEATIPVCGSGASLAMLKQTMDEDEEKKVGEARLIELATFPGFDPEGYTPLPHGLTPPFIMDLVTSAHIRSTATHSFRETWKAFFTSKPSECLLMDCFWWFFLHHYHPDQEAQGKLFCRISTNYVKVLLSITASTHTKDALLRIYLECIAQCVYATFMHAFPNSWNSFDERLKSNLCNTLYLWFGGVKPYPNGWNKWNTKTLEPKLLGKLKLAAVMQSTENGHDLFGSHTQTITTASNMPITREVAWAPDNMDTSKSSVQSITDIGCYGNKTRQPSKASQSQPSKDTTTLSEAVDNKHAVMPLPPTQCSESAKHAVQTAHVMFDRCGHSPLVQLYLAQHHLFDEAGYSMLMKRTEVTKLPPTTYQEVVMESNRAGMHTCQQFDKLYHYQKEAARRAEAQRKQAVLQHNREVKEVLSSKRNVQQLSNEIAGILGHKRLHTQDDTSKNAISAAISKIVKH